MDKLQCYITFILDVWPASQLRQKYVCVYVCVCVCVCVCASTHERMQTT